jgi:uncharacterized membrane protein YeaQ/YmgE (transglycosylase-associated protein family)
MEILYTIVIGFIVGLVARLVKPGRDNMGLVLTAVLGIVGAMLGGFLGRALGIYAPDEPAGFLASVVGAIIVLMAYYAITGRRPAKV